MVEQISPFPWKPRQYSPEELASLGARERAAVKIRHDVCMVRGIMESSANAAGNIYIGDEEYGVNAQNAPLWLQWLEGMSKTKGFESGSEEAIIVAGVVDCRMWQSAEE